MTDDNRLAIIRVGEDRVLGLVTDIHALGDVISIRKFNLPSDAKVIRVDLNPRCRSFDFIVRSDEFDIVPEYDEIPVMHKSIADITHYLLSNTKIYEVKKKGIKK